MGWLIPIPFLLVLLAIVWRAQRKHVAGREALIESQAKRIKELEYENYCLKYPLLRSRDD
jgi:cytochrome c-type biogenesis protein CcmH/NrfF